MSTVVVIGAGLAGMVAANRLADAGCQVVLLHQGLGGLQSGQGTMDVFGYNPARVSNPIKAVAAEVRRKASSTAISHPYRTLGTKRVRIGIEYLAEVLPALLIGDLESNYQLSTAVGAVRPTCLAQPSMVAGDLTAGKQLVIVGLRQLKDFNPELVAANLNRTELPGGGRLNARHLLIEFRARLGISGATLEGEVDSSAVTYARAFDDPQYRVLFAKTLAPKLAEVEVVGLPAVLGLRDLNAWQHLADLLGHRVFEIPLPPPSVPGMRLNEALTARAVSLGVRMVPGVRVIGFHAEAGRVVLVRTQPGAATRDYRGDAFLLATGGFEAGGLTIDSHGSVSETLFDLPLAGLGGSDPLVHGDYWGREQPLFNLGVRVDPTLRPVDASAQPVYANLYAAGGLLAGSSGWRDKTGDGVAVASAVAAADAIAKELA